MFELLISSLVIVILVGLLLPAVQQAREASRRINCSQQLAQLAIAAHCFESANERLPSAWLPIPSSTQGWSAQMQLLPWLDQSTVYDQLLIGQAWSGQSISTNRGVIAASDFPVNVFRCPSVRRLNPGDISYGVNRGTWVMWDPVAQEGGDGVFVAGPRGIRMNEILDGLQTFAFAEVLPGTSFHQNPRKTKPMKPLRFGEDQEILGGTSSSVIGHTQWINGVGIHTGFTVPSIANPGHWFNFEEGTKDPSIAYAIIPPGSMHVGGFNVAAVDGSVLYLSYSIDPRLLHGLTTRSGGEIDSVVD